MTREDIPAELVERDRGIHEAWAKDQGKPEQAIPKIVDGRMEKFFGERVLLDQPFIQDEDVTVRELINRLVGKIGEKLELKRFIRWQVGQTDGAAAPAEEQA